MILYSIFKYIFHISKCVIVQCIRLNSMMSVVIMSGTMKLFQSARAFYETVGIYPSTSVQSYKFSWRNFAIIYILTTQFLATSTYFLFKTNINIDYVETLQSFYFSSTSFNFLISFVINFCKMSNIFKLMDRFEETIQSSKLKYVDGNQ